MQSKFCKKDVKVAQVNDNYDLLQYRYKCPHHQYSTRIIERSPLIIYIEKFLTQNEMQHLIKLTEKEFKPSTIGTAHGKATIGKDRTSSTAFIRPHQTPVVQCIERRFAQFQGDVDVDCIEPFQVYVPHYDWMTNSNELKIGGQRITSFFTYLQANCSMGETEFVAIPFNRTSHEQFCDILVCDEKATEHGLRFRPIPGNTIFWYNIDEYGQVDDLTYHAGRPPGENGTKIGLNVWTREKKFRPSKVGTPDGKVAVSKNRTSSTAAIKRHQTPVVQCIERRFAQFQGDVDVDCIEPFQVVKYTNDQEYTPHYDWMKDPNNIKIGGQRVTTYFTYLQANCSMGETEFVMIPFNKTFHERFCDILVCDENATEHGIRFRPIPGNTIFWYNMDEYGQADNFTLHAGRPPGENGTKIGLNVWTRLEKFSMSAIEQWQRSLET
ncbi:unnamed protein product [Adineta steineri]|uniref:Fe2OG dioxygenase domain-containing protein n=1 Tax=Adineta steineri TaxID=433720 RepID=A0A813NXX1_9BILA|nr:unnamed protein product [Adineta steineri]